MKIVKHISFYYIENKTCYINQILDSTNLYKIETDIFIHTNKPNLQVSDFNSYTNGKLEIVYHSLTDIHPYCLTWMCRSLLYKQQNDYDIFIYIEDDILVPYKAIEYWLEYSEKINTMNYNLGFLRIEIDNQEEYITDLLREQFDKIVILNNTLYCVNDKNPYCAFWIYNKKEFHKFANSTYFNLDAHKLVLREYYSTRETSASGLHNKSFNWYKDTLIPIVNNYLIEDCKIYHISNTYIKNNWEGFSTIKFNEAINWENSVCIWL